MPAGVINVNEDSEDEEDYFGAEQKERAKEAQEIRAAQQWVNHAGWDAAGEGRATTSSG